MSPAARRFPLVPATTGDLELGDLFAVPLKGGDLSVFQVRGLKTSGSGAYTHFVAGIVDWRAPSLPVGFDLRGRRVLVEGVLRFETFGPDRAQVFGNSDLVVPPVAWSDLTKAFTAGTNDEVWSWKSLRRRAGLALADRARGS